MKPDFEHYSPPDPCEVRYSAIEQTATYGDALAR